MPKTIDFGMSRSQFQSSLFESRPHLWRKCFDESNYGWDLINSALELQDPTRDLIKILCDGRVEPESYVEEYIDVGIRRRRIIKDRLYNILDSGGTLVINRIELVSPAVRQICHEVGRFVGALTSSNAYASFGGKIATNVHWDTHDVFVVQIGGRKHWQIFEPTHPLPISSQISNDRKHEITSDPMLDCIIEAGDVLYVPRGWWHRVVPVLGSETLHLTVAVQTPLILDYLVWASASVLPEFLQLRHSLIGQAADSKRISEAASVIASTLCDPTNLERFYARSHQRERVMTPFDIQSLSHRRQIDFDGETTVMINSRYASSNMTSLTINGKEAKFEGAHRDVLEALAGDVVLEISNIRGKLSQWPVETLNMALFDLARADLISIENPATNFSENRAKLSA